MGPYLRLMRFHKPSGTVLLWCPTAWALWLTTQRSPAWSLTLLFLVGTVLMRAAGCVLNDIADRHVDGHVERTRLRPLVAGEVSLIQAFCVLLFLLIGALITLIQLPPQCFYYALGAMFITILYPFCKRFIEGPQCVLGLAFSMGIPMAFAATNQRPNATMFILLTINFCWIIAYDTQYALVDRDDDLRIGIKSTAILFGSYEQFIIKGLQFFFHFLWIFVACSLHFSFQFLVCWCAALMLLLYQQNLIAKQQKESYLKAFTSNSWYGLIMWLALML